MRTIGPAPKRWGETLTRALVIAAVTLIGAGGRGLFAYSPPLPQPASAISPKVVHP
jgi:hypothetical protein